MGSYYRDGTTMCLGLLALQVSQLRGDISDAYDEEGADVEVAEQSEEQRRKQCDGEEKEEDKLREAADAMQYSASTDDEQAEWMDEATMQPHTATPTTDDEYDGSITPTPSRSSSLSLSNHNANTSTSATTSTRPRRQLPFHSIAADRQQTCELHGDGCPSDHTQQSRSAIIITEPRHVTPAFDSAHQQLVNTLSSPAAAKSKRQSDIFLPPMLAPPHFSLDVASEKENVSPNTSLPTPSTGLSLTLKSSPQSAFSAVQCRSPASSLDELSPSVTTASSLSSSDSALMEAKRRKTVHASLTRSFQTLPVEQQPSVRGVGSLEVGAMHPASVGRRMPR